jgi:hypothetical protein
VVRFAALPQLQAEGSVAMPLGRIFRSVSAAGGPCLMRALVLPLQAKGSVAMPLGRIFRSAGR